MQMDLNCSSLIVCLWYEFQLYFQIRDCLLILLQILSKFNQVTVNVRFSDDFRGNAS